MKIALFYGDHLFPTTPFIATLDRVSETYDEIIVHFRAYPFLMEHDRPLFYQQYFGDRFPKVRFEREYFIFSDIFTKILKHKETPEFSMDVFMEMEDEIEVIREGMARYMAPASFRSIYYETTGVPNTETLVRLINRGNSWLFLSALDYLFVHDYPEIATHLFTLSHNQMVLGLSYDPVSGTYFN